MENYIKKHGDQDDEAVVHALNGCLALTLPMVLKAAIKLDLFEIIGSITGGDVVGASPSAIVAELPRSISLEGMGALDSMLRLLAAHSYLTCSTKELNDGGTETRYGLSPAGRCFVRDQSGVSLAPFLDFNCNRNTTDFWFNLEGAVLGKGSFYEKVYGKHAYEYISSHPELGGMFNEAMVAHSTVTMKKAVETYKGFENLGSLVNVGGGYGVSLDTIISKYPSIRGINFDLPQVIQNASSYKGIEHIGGNMFHQVPQGDAILLKHVLHNWSDEQCLILLKNCHKALPNKGKVIAMECILRDQIHDQADVHAKFASQMNLIMVTTFGGKVRTENELRSLATKAGFSQFKPVCYANGTWITEFLKSE